MDVNRALKLATTQLTPYTPSPRIDTEVLLAHTLETTRTRLYTFPDRVLTKDETQRFQQMVARRSLGMPVAYLTGVREFWSLPLNVSEETLIPRPETELVVDTTLTLMGDARDLTLLDLGTGSGAIALALAKERPYWQLIASDASPGALKMAMTNAQSLGLEQVSFCLSDWFSHIDEAVRFDGIVSNPPYIAANDPHLQEGDLRFEPTLALVAGKNGLFALEHIITHSFLRLKPGGWLLMEHGFDQKTAVMEMLETHGYTKIQCWADLHGYGRVSGGQRPLE